MLTVDHRFRGPTSSGNGGSVAGRLAGDGDEPVTVVLKAAPPLDRPLTVTERDGLTELRDGSTLVGTASRAPGASLTRCIVMGRLVGSEGRKVFTETSVYGADRRRLGRAASVWVTVPGAPG